MVLAACCDLLRVQFHSIDSTKKTICGQNVSNYLLGRFGLEVNRLAIIMNYSQLRLTLQEECKLTAKSHSSYSEAVNKTTM